MPATTRQLIIGCALMLACRVAGALPFPAVEILQGPPPSDYCQTPRVPALFNVHTRPGDTYYGRGTFKVNGVQVHQGPISPFSFPAGVVSSSAPMPPAFTPGVVYPPGAVFTSISTYYNALLLPTYENELTIRCDTGQIIHIRNTDLTPPPVPLSPWAPFAAIACAAAILLRQRRASHTDA